MICAACVLSLAYLSMGSYQVGLGEILDIACGGGIPEARLVVLEIRLPRLIGALCTGAALSLCGAVMQSIFNNPLVSPDILGVSSGAACGAATALVAGCGSVAVGLAAFGCGMLAVLLALAVAGLASGGRSPVLVLVLAGIVVSAFFSGIVEMICAFNPHAEEFPSILFFLFGSMTRITVSDLPLLISVLAASGLLLWRMGYALDVISLGEEDASRLGVPAAALRYLVIAISSVICGIFIAKAGMIGWVGLIIPHIARLMLGVRHRVMLPGAMLAGGVFLAAVDLLCRNLFTYELPLGVVTSLIGAPVFVVILCRSMRKYGGA